LAGTDVRCGVLKQQLLRDDLDVCACGSIWQLDFILSVCAGLRPVGILALISLVSLYARLVEVRVYTRSLKLLLLLEALLTHA
jgi:hypothetical protein